MKKIKALLTVSLSTALDTILTLAAVMIIAVFLVPAFSIQSGKARYKYKLEN